MSNYNSQLQSNNTDLQRVLQTLQNKAAGGEQATPVISVNSTNGLITATAGTKSATHQLAFQPAKTITPSSTSQIAVSSGYYTGGNIVVAGDSNLVASNIVSGKTIFGVVGTATAKDGPFTYTVDTISGAQYGFAKNSNGYYESQNKGQNNSYAICRINLTVAETCNIIFDVINYAESNYDYALFGDLDKTLSLSNTADTSINVKKNFRGQQSASVVNVVYSDVSIGNHYIDIKFIKDPSQHSNNDSVQFKIQDNMSAEDGLVTCTLTHYTNDRVTTIGSDAFYFRPKLTTVNFPNVTTIDRHAFYNCSGLTTVSFPNTTIISNYAFYNCSRLTTVSFPNAMTIRNSAFYNCYNLGALYLTSPSVCTLSHSNAFGSTPIGGYSTSTGTYGSIYVPASLLTAYQTATNWTYFSSRFVEFQEGSSGGGGSDI